MPWPEKIRFLDDWQAAFAKAARENKQVYLDFFTQDCIGCRQMAETTYVDDRVADFLNSRVVPLAVDPDALPYSEDYHCRWTPYLLVLDRQQAIQQSTYGYLTPQELLPWVLLGLAKCDFKAKNWPGAIELLDEALEMPEHTSRPEAIYHRAVARARNESNAMHLKRMHEELEKDYPGHPWTIRSRPYRLL